MRFRSILGPASLVVLSVMATASRAQSGPPPAPPLPKPSAGAYKVAFWYDLNLPTTSIQFCVYDLSKAEFDDPAVKAWQRLIFEKYPNYGAYVRDLQTNGEPGATESERLTSAIDREKRRWADLQRQPSRPIPSVVSPTFSRGVEAQSRARSRFDILAPGSSGGYSSSPSSPFPYPYRSGPR